MSFCGRTCGALKARLWQNPRPISINTSSAEAAGRRGRKDVLAWKRVPSLNLTLQQVTCSSGPGFYWSSESQQSSWDRSWAGSPLLKRLQKKNKHQFYCNHALRLRGLKCSHTCVGEWASTQVWSTLSLQLGSFHQVQLGHGHGVSPGSTRGRGVG